MKRSSPIISQVIVLLGFILSACSAYDLGSEGIYKYDIGNQVENPPWENAIDVIVEKKCATCHTSANPWYKPKNVDSSGYSKQLESIATKDFWKKGEPVMTIIKECLENVCGVEKIPMPPNYATPLSPEEKQALLNFVKPLLPEASAGFSAKFTTCEGCHGKQGAGQGNFPKLAGTKLTLDQFKTIIRGGKGGMPAYAADAYSDADLEKDHTQLKTLP